MVKRSLSWFILLLTFFDVFVKTHLTEHDSSHGFVSKQHERYLVDDISSIHEELASGVRSSALKDPNLKLLLKFDPEFLDFKKRPLGVPHLKKVTLFNVDSNKTIDMTSISGSTVHFHSSFFEDKRIPPLGNTSFNVVFLGREEGTIESNLFIHTTEGHFKYQVKGASVSSPYRLRPIVGIKLPLNTTFSPLIHMHNPYTEPIQIVEIYSSGGDFHLELPSGELEGPKDMWEIPPLQTKPIIRVRFQAKTEQNHTAYVRIKVNNTDDVLVVPLEVEVTSNAGLYTPQGSVDFGVGGSLDPPKHVKLNVHNPLKKHVRIHSVTTTSKAIKIDFETVKISPDVTYSKSETSSVEIATLTVDWKIAFDTQDFSGKIVVKYKNGKSKTEIPYYLTVLEGGLLFNSSNTTYFINDTREELLSRNVVVKNGFLTSVALINISLPAEANTFFYISNFKPMILKPQEETTIFTLKLKPDAAMSNLKINSRILLGTNISDIEFPLLSYNGKLQLHLPYTSKDDVLDLGLISLDTKKEAYFLILNTNPVDIKIRKMSTSLKSTMVEVVGCNKDGHMDALIKDISKNMTKCTKLATGEYAILRLKVSTPQVEGLIRSDVVIETQYEHLVISVHYKVAQGKLEIGPDRLVFDKCFPGKICSHPLRVHSTFNDPMFIENIISIPPDIRVSSKHTGHIMARSTKVIGHLYLDPTLGCQQECYSGLQQNASAQWFQTLTLPKTTPDLDLSLVNVLYNRYLNQTANGFKKWQNLTMRLDTSEVKGHIFKTRVKMSWPSLVVEQSLGNKTVFTFPLTQVGNVTYQNITIRNPSSHNLGVQLVMDQIYPEFQSLHEGLPPNFMPTSDNSASQSHGFFFHSAYKEHLDVFKILLGVDVHEKTLPVLLSPGENFTFVIGFHAHDSSLNSAYLYIRNNLTVIEVIKLHGQGAHPNFKFGNRKPGSSQPLAFELTEKHLKDCDREKHKKYPAPNLTVKRTFTARNTGDVTIFINDFFINGLSCEGYGFKVLNCEPFALAPNSTRKIDIAFTPDFTLAKITRTLVLETSLNFLVNYTLMTTVPPYYLALCSNVLVRPLWEPYLYYTAVCLMCFLLGFVVIMPVMESERILKQAVGVMITRNNTAAQPTLDLRLVGAQTRSEIHSQRSDSESNDCKLNKEVKCDTKTNKCDSSFVLDDCSKAPKPEPEKYTALVPATGKSKKRLSKKNSNDLVPSESAHEMQKKVCVDTQKSAKNKVVENKIQICTGDIDPVKKTVISTNKENKKVTQCKKNLVKHCENAMFEEETSSTTTESSNNEEVDKDEKLPIVHNKKSQSPKNDCNHCTTETHHLNDISLDINNIIKTQRKKTTSKLVPKTKEKDVIENKTEIKPSSECKHKGNKNSGRERKDKLTLNKKLSDKGSKLLNESFGTNNGTAVRVSPTTQFSNVWGENRAKFSDVVARSDNAVTTQIRPSLTQPQVQTSKPTMYVEPYKQKTASLGPIGSRKSETYQENSILNHGTNLQEHQFNNLSNSFFSEAHNLSMESSNQFLNFGSGEIWEQRNTSTLMNLMQPNAGVYSVNPIAQAPGDVNTQDPWNHTINSTGVWDGAYNPPVNEVVQPQPVVNQQSGYLWGSSSVWQPWAPAEVPRTPTRTPPGFAPNPEMEERLQRNQTYDPFGMTSIWAQQQSHPWNYPQSQ